MKICLKILLLLVLTFTGDSLRSQSYNGAFFESFYGRNPGARSEALGGCSVSLTGDPFSHYANPASLATIYGGFAAIAHSSDYYANPGATFDYFSVAYRVGKIGTFGIMIEEIVPNWTDSSSVIPSISELTAQRTSYDRIYYARPITESLYWGIGIAFLQPLFSFNPSAINNIQKEVDDYGGGFDLGLLKYISFHSDKNFHQLNLGLSLSNIFVFPYESSALPSPIGLPSVVRIGANYSFTKNFDFQAGLMLEYEDNINSDYYEAIHAGLELTFFEWLVLRSGYFAQDLRDCIDCNTSASRFTYGLGIRIAKVPFMEFPVSLGFDALLMEQLPLQKKQILWGAAGMISLHIGVVF